MNTVRLWKERFLAERLAGLWSRHRGKSVSKGVARLEARIVDLTLRKPTSDGSTHWSSRKLAARLGGAGNSLTRCTLMWSPAL